MRKFLVVPFLLFPMITWSQEFYLFAGTYDSPESEGIYVFRFNSQTAETRLVSHFRTGNPSFLTLSPDEKFLYAVEEIASGDGRGGNVKALAFHKQSGELTLLNEQPTGGDHPCHIETDRTGKWVFAANYSGGSISVFPVLPDGSLGPPTITKHSGSGPHPRQKSPHVHANIISADNKWLLTTDLGTDRVKIYSFDAGTGKLDPGKSNEMIAIPGSGPRMSVFHPNHPYFYVVEELSGHVSMYKFKNGRLKKKQRISSMIAGDTSFAGSAHVLVSEDGRFLYASNRGTSNNIAIFLIGKKGRLKLTGHQSTLGAGPRYFTISPGGKFLLAGNQNSNEILVFERDRAKGSLTFTGNKIKLGKPVCLKWATVN